MNKGLIMEDIKYYEERIKILEKARTDLFTSIDIINRNIDDCYYKISELKSQNL